MPAGGGGGGGTNPFAVGMGIADPCGGNPTGGGGNGTTPFGGGGGGKGNPFRAVPGTLAPGTVDEMVVTPGRVDGIAVGTVEEIVVIPEEAATPGTVEEMVVTPVVTSLVGTVDDIVETKSPTVPSLLTTRAGCNIVKTESPPKLGTAAAETGAAASPFFSTGLPSNSAIKAL